VVLRLVDRVGRFVQFHAAQSTGRRGTLLTPPPLQAGTSRWIRSDQPWRNGTLVGLRVEL